MKKHFIAQKWLGYAALILICSCTLEKEVEIPEHIGKLDNLTVHQTGQQADTVHLEKEQIFGNTEDVLIGSPSQLEADSSGRVYIGDSQQKSIHIFQPDGNYFTSIG